MQKLGTLLRLRDDGIAGSAGFLFESFEHLEEQNKNHSAAQYKTLQPKNFLRQGANHWSILLELEHDIAWF